MDGSRRITSPRTSPTSPLAASSSSRRARDRKRAALRDPAHTKVFDLEKLLEPVLRPLAADARLLHAAKRRHLRRDDPRIDADDAVFERLGDAPDASDIATVEVRGEPELRVVGEGNRLGLGRESKQRRNRPE